MGNRRKPVDAYHVCLSANSVNGILAALDCIILADAQNCIAKQADKLKKKIIQHGRTFQIDGMDSVSIYFFASEIIPLIKILALYLSVTKRPNTNDYYTEIGKQK